MGFEALVRAQPRSTTGLVGMDRAFAAGELWAAETYDSVPRVDEVAVFVSDDVDDTSPPVTSVQVTMQAEVSTELRDELVRRIAAAGKKPDDAAPSLPEMARSMLPGARLIYRLRNLRTSFKVRVHNRGVRPVLLMMGDVLAGGFADRVVARDIIVHPGVATDIDAFCVEGGRNHGDSPEFADAGLLATPSLRRRMIDTSQPRLWAAIAEDLRSLGLDIPNASYRQITSEPAVASAVEAHTHLIPALWPVRAVGIALRVDGAIVFADTFTTPTAFHRSIDRLAQSYVLEVALRSVAGQPGACTIEPLIDTTEVSEFGRHCSECSSHSFFYSL